MIDYLPPEFHYGLQDFAYNIYASYLYQLMVIHSSFVLLSLHIGLKFEMIKKSLIFGYFVITVLVSYYQYLSNLNLYGI